jgi:hypothetical protein
MAVEKAGTIATARFCIHHLRIGPNFRVLGDSSGHFLTVQGNTTEMPHTSAKGAMTSAFSRAQYHLSLVLREQKKSHKEAGYLQDVSVGVLEQLYADIQCPLYLTDKTLTMARFAWTQPPFDGRWTGRELLGIVQRYYSTSGSSPGR